MSPNWYYAKDDRQFGPVSSDELFHLLRTGDLNPDHLVWREGMPDWRPVRDAFDLAPPPDPVQPTRDPGFASSPPPEAPADGWYYAVAGQRFGPTSAVALENLLRQGRIGARDLLWRAGMPDWKPAGQVAEFAHLAQTSPPFSRAPSDNPFAAPQSDQLPSGFDPNPPSRFGGYAGFWARVAAFIVDRIIVGAAAFAVGMVFGFALILANGGDAAILDGSVGYLLNLLGFIGEWLYFALMESSQRQATVGKMAVGIVVCDLEGRRISFGRATGRYFAKILSVLTLFIGFLMVAWTERKQGLHDMIAGTLVYRRY